MGKQTKRGASDQEAMGGPEECIAKMSELCRDQRIESGSLESHFLLSFFPAPVFWKGYVRLFHSGLLCWAPTLSSGSIIFYFITALCYN